MTNFNCEYCNYFSDQKSNYDRHLTTIRHTKNIKLVSKSEKSNIINNLKQRSLGITSDPANDHTDQNLSYICNYCKKVFSQKTNLYRHMRNICSGKNQKELLEKEIALLILNKDQEREIALLKQKNELLQQAKEIELLKQKDALREQAIKREVELLELINKENKEDKNYLRHTNDNSMSALNYAIRNFTNAPPITQVPLLTHEGYEDDKDKYVESILYKYEYDCLVEYIGKLLIQKYKKENPQEQSLWSTDHSRYNYLLRIEDKDFIEKSQEIKKRRGRPKKTSSEIIQSKWITDKEGIRCNESIVRPYLAALKRIITLYMTDHPIKQEMSANESAKCVNKMRTITQIIRDIDDKNLEKEIIRYITADFYLNKEK